MLSTVKPTHKTLAAYQEKLRASHKQGRHEGALATTFQRLQADTSWARGWMLVPKQST
jgi:hypothetical protein